ncbi:hypothetical protein Namu_4617 [Nakamurella multipartita DSM 44233]|uniref:Uncharacterized protein n=1 Tax=Nakamurella multipartita (strain ATCC 700099 / DSM 44233 / CIP 104796 / JCM 9543 / NBRC 105858 / Y-104) TaxID=479431 RepID=C8X6Z8_NAKMY|nr:hypothetical protein [Nakamurella multipartita]ACV80896.1 hypothetical protein Namu_4617 [Nakamurella multipartita DSM 44233]
MAATDAGPDGVTGTAHTGQDMVGGAAKLIGDAGSRLALDVAADGFVLVFVVQALVAHLDTSLFEDTENSALAESVGLHELAGAVAGFVVGSKLLEDFGWEAVVQFVDEAGCGSRVGLGFVTVRRQMAFQVTERRRNGGEMF